MQTTQIDLKKIKQLREQKGLTQEVMAVYLGYKTATGYHYLESGKRAIDADKLFIIAQTLGVRVEDLFFTHHPTKLVDDLLDNKAQAS